MTSSPLPAALEAILKSVTNPVLHHAIEPDASLAEDLRFDDLDLITIAQECDERWLIEIAEDDWRLWQTVEDVRATVERLAGVPV
jgi:acyl carrier protein